MMHRFWQDFSTTPASGPPYADRYSVELALGRYLDLPIRPLPDPSTAVASFIANQAGFTVVEFLTARMVELAKPFAPDIIVGLPTLGLAFAPGVAKGLGHGNFVPLGYSRKFWYRDDHSVAISSITTPDAGKRLFIDPLILPRLAGKRVVVVDDVVSTGRSLRAATALLSGLGVAISGYVVAMTQGRGAEGLDVASVFRSPRFVRGEGGGWMVSE
jgi:adenine/guanine phosphoribosyltransferase-like PRPP-binding protein